MVTSPKMNKILIVNSNILSIDFFGKYSSMHISRDLFSLLPAATKLGQGNIFTPVCDSVNRGGTWSGPRGGTWQTPPRPGTPPPRDQTRHTPPQTRPPQDQTPPQPGTPPLLPPDQTPPPPDQTPSRSSTTSGRYASYWNAFLFSDQFEFCWKYF